MKKFFRNFIVALLATFAVVLMFNIFESKPFKFENFKTAAEAKAYLDEHYPLGTDINKILKDVSLAGAKCMERPEKIREKFEYDKVYICEYWNNFISLHPFDVYTLLLYSDIDGRLVDIFVKKESKLQVP